MDTIIQKATRKRLTAEERLAAITRAVIPIFAKKGFAATTTKELAKAAGVSEALLYRHFPSKESIYDHIQEQICTTDSSIHDYVHKLVPGSESIVKMVYLVFKIVFETDKSHPLGSSIARLLIQSLLEDGEFTRSFNEPRFKQMVPHMGEFVEAAIAAGEMEASPFTPQECNWFPHHLAVALRLAYLPNDSVYDYGSEPRQRMLHGIWFSLRGLGLREHIIKKYLIPEQLDPAIDDVLYKAGMRSTPPKKS